MMAVWSIKHAIALALPTLTADFPSAPGTINPVIYGEGNRLASPIELSLEFIGNVL
jgi:hypothetical protein